MGNVTLQNVSEEKGHFILWETGQSTLWERFFSSGNRTTYPLGIGSLILWESDHLSSGNRTIILWETGHGKRDTLFSGNREFGNRFLTVWTPKLPYEPHFVIFRASFDFWKVYKIFRTLFLEESMSQYESLNIQFSNGNSL